MFFTKSALWADRRRLGLSDGALAGPAGIAENGLGGDLSGELMHGVD
jgi:hypothetical protein